MKDFVKRNFVLILGIALPVILILVFSAIRLTAQFVDPPEYKPVFAIQLSYGEPEPFSFLVDEEGALSATFESNPGFEVPRNYQYSTSLIIFDPESEFLQMATVYAPKDFEQGEQYALDLPDDFRNLRIIPGDVSPDGYMVNPADRDRGNLFTALFGYGDYYSRYVLTKQGRKYPIDLGGMSYGTFTFIGWVPLAGADDDQTEQ